MKDYSEMSDAEINQCITSIVDKCDKWCLSKDGSYFYDCGIDGSQFYTIPISDYCNNPSDMWPLIVANGITLVHCGADNTYAAAAKYSYIDISMEEYIEGDEVFGGTGYFDKNPLRAAAIVFLMLNDG